MSNTVIFLGAGASKADGAPLQSELFQAFVKWIRKKEKKWPQQGIVKEFFTYFFGIEDIYSDGDAVFPTFEEALCVLDLAIDRNEEYRDAIHPLEDYRLALVFAMAKAIQYKLDIEPDVQNRESIHHSKLIHYLFEKEHHTVNVIKLSNK